MGLVEPAWHTSPAWTSTLGPEVVDLAALCRTPYGQPFAMYPEQKLLLDDWFGYRPDGTRSCFKGVVIACRQNLKTGVMKAAALGKLFIEEQRLVIWTAQAFFAVAEAYRDLVALIESSRDLSGELVNHVGGSNPFIELSGDRRIIFRTRGSDKSENKMRSLSCDALFFDEGYTLSGSDLSSIEPTMLARPGAQEFIGSSAGLASSAVLRDHRDRGRKGDPTMAYAEWCGPNRPCASPNCQHYPGTPGCALDDPELRRAGNPRLVRGEMTMDALDALRMSMASDPMKFARECIGWWDEPEKASDGVDLVALGECEDRTHQSTGEEFFVLDVSPARSRASIVVGSVGDDGFTHVEVTGRDDQVDCRPGTGWIVPRAVEMDASIPGFELWVIEGSPAAALIQGLENAGVSVQTLAARDYVAASGHIVDLVSARTLRHIGQPEIISAAEAAVKRDSGDAFCWGRKRSARDITAWVAASCAAWLAQGGADYDIGDSIL